LLYREDKVDFFFLKKKTIHLSPKHLSFSIEKNHCQANKTHSFASNIHDEKTLPKQTFSFKIQQGIKHSSIWNTVKLTNF